ncbi:MAG TPA: glutamate cyclase domain-containing protein [Pirellulales bacterium]|nr:glutamate cyclase domain-containing protein [Pirellulales bacterium]
MPTVDREFWLRCRELLCRDPGRRGLVSAGMANDLLAAGGLEPAARALAGGPSSVGIVTGFYVAGSAGPTVETDGPPGALYLAQALRNLGIDATLVTDRLGGHVLQAGCRQLGLPPEIVRSYPFDDLPPAWSHLVAIERPGPSHTIESLLAQDAPSDVHEFQSLVPPEERDVCHNLRGENISPYTAPIHELFERAPRARPPITTIGIADGGNEIGMGCVPWGLLRRAIAIGPAERVVCRIATDHLIVAGVSDWGAYALAAGVCMLRGRCDALAPLDANSQAALVAAIVAAGAIDGITKRAEATVDGLPLATYLQTLIGLRRLCGFDA